MPLDHQRFGRLLVLERAPAVPGTHDTRWVCRCDCGASVIAYGGNLRRGRSRSCGCLRAEVSRTKETTHGAARHRARGHRVPETPEYRAWCHAKARCFNPNTDHFEHYGGRGITMCSLWVHDFAAFLRHIGPRPPGTSLDRIDPDGHYEPGNVRWATRQQQRSNRRDSS
jgi:hypothetical protein